MTVSADWLPRAQNQSFETGSEVAFFGGRGRVCHNFEWLLSNRSRVKDYLVYLCGIYCRHKGVEPGSCCVLTSLGWLVAAWSLVQTLPIVI